MFSQENFLLHAIIPDEWYEIDYNPRVAGALSKAFAVITPTPRHRDAFQRARTHILPYANDLMSRRQRARVLYVLGVFCMDGEFYPHASDYLDEALDHAVALHSFAESAKLAHLLGTIQGQAHRYGRASYYHSFALNALAEGPYPPDYALAADAAIALASCHFALEQYDTAGQCLADATRYTSHLAPASKQVAALKWMWAMCYRWRGQPAQALPLAFAAAAIYSRIGSAAAQSRIEGIVADCACDLAISYSSADYAYDAYLKLALHHTARSLNLTMGTTDISGRALALLREIRLTRLTGTSYNWLDTAENIIEDSSITGDIPLLAQAYTTLGEQFSALDERELGLHCYRAALDVLSGTDALNLRRWPLSAILLDSEMRVE